MNCTRCLEKKNKVEAVWFASDGEKLCDSCWAKKLKKQILITGQGYAKNPEGDEDGE